MHHGLYQVVMFCFPTHKCGPSTGHTTCDTYIIVRIIPNAKHMHTSIFQWRKTIITITKENKLVLLLLKTYSQIKTDIPSVGSLFKWLQQQGVNHFPIMWSSKQIISKNLSKPWTENIRTWVMRGEIWSNATTFLSILPVTI